MCLSSWLWGRVLDCGNQFTILSPQSFNGPQLWRSMSVCSSLYLLTHAHCAWCSPSTRILLWLASYLLAPAGGRTQSPDCALPKRTQVWGAYLCNMIGKELVFLSFLYIKLFELGVEVQLGLTCLFFVIFFEQPRLHNARRQHNFLELCNLLCLISRLSLFHLEMNGINVVAEGCTYFPQLLVWERKENPEVGKGVQ